MTPGKMLLSLTVNGAERAAEVYPMVEIFA